MSLDIICKYNQKTANEKRLSPKFYFVVIDLLLFKMFYQKHRYVYKFCVSQHAESFRRYGCLWSRYIPSYNLSM